jgi:hypothetical protein
MEPNLNLKYLLEKGIVCQPRTGKHKQYTIIVENNNEIIYKGPYLNERIRVIMGRKEILQPLTNHVVFPIKSIKLDEGNFLIFPNVDSVKNIKYRDYEEKMTGDKYRVMERINLVKLSDYLREQTEIDVKIPFSFFMDFIYLHLLSVGDVHLSNCLYDLKEKKLYIIDIEENRKDKEADTREDFYFSLSPNVKVKKWWLDQVRPYYNQAITILTNLDNFDKEKIKQAITYLSPNQIKIDYNKMKVTELKEELKKRKLPVSGKKEDLIKRLTTRTEQVIGGVKGKMQYGGYMGENTTFSGYAIDVVKSAMQKYIRRNMVEKALISMIELYRMPEVDGDAKSIQSNMFNRLAVIAAEDIGPSNVKLVEEVIRYVMEDTRNLEDLYHYVILLCNSPKTRIMSHLWRTYATLEGRQEALKHGIVIDNVSNNIVECRTEFVKKLKEKNHQSVFILGRYIELVQESKKEMQVIWEEIKKINNSSIINICEKAYFKFSEQRPFLMMAIVYILYMDKISDKNYKVESTVKLNDLLEGNYEYVVDDYCVDKHTKEGREQGKDRKEFVVEGSLVSPQEMELFDEKYYKIYCDS